jgi:hypothetical protein
MREGGVKYLALCKGNQIFHQGEAIADLRLEQKQIELRLNKVL